MITLQNLETKIETLKGRVGTLAIEKLQCLERAELTSAAIAEETTQIAILLKVFDALMEDLKKDESAEASMMEQIESMASKILNLEGDIAAMMSASKENDEEGESVMTPD